MLPLPSTDFVVHSVSLTFLLLAGIPTNPKNLVRGKLSDAIIGC